MTVWDLYERRGAENAERRGGIQMHENEISERIIGAAIEVRRILGPGLYELGGHAGRFGACDESGIRVSLVGHP